MLWLLSTRESDRKFLQARIRSVGSPSELVRRLAHSETVRPKPKKWHIAMIGFGNVRFIES